MRLKPKIIALASFLFAGVVIILLIRYFTSHTSSSGVSHPRFSDLVYNTSIQFHEMLVEESRPLDVQGVFDGLRSRALAKVPGLVEVKADPEPSSWLSPEFGSGVKGVVYISYEIDKDMYGVVLANNNAVIQGPCRFSDESSLVLRVDIDDWLVIY